MAPGLEPCSKSLSGNPRGQQGPHTFLPPLQLALTPFETPGQGRNTSDCLGASSAPGTMLHA